MISPQRIAIQTALQSKCNYLVGAVLTDGKKKILAKACNKTNSHPKGSGIFSTAHSEMNCLFKYLRLNNQKIRGHLYVARVSKTLRFGLARPCPDCWRLLQSVGIKQVVYTSPEGWRKEMVV